MIQYLQVEARDCSLCGTSTRTPSSASTTARSADQTRPQTTPAQVGRKNNPPTCKIIHRHVKIFGNFGNNRVWVINVSTPGRNINFTLTTTQGNELLILVYEQGRIYSTGIPHTTIDRGSVARLGNLFPPVGSNCAARM